MDLLPKLFSEATQIKRHLIFARSAVVGGFKTPFLLWLSFGKFSVGIGVYNRVTKSFLRSIQQQSDTAVF